MGDLTVTVYLRGQVIEDRVVPVRQAVRLGEGQGAAVAFPDADLVVMRAPGGLLVRGRTLAEGEQMRLELGAVHVRLAHVAAERLATERWTNFDLRFLACAIVAAALTTWLDAAGAALSAVEASERSENVTATTP